VDAPKEALVVLVVVAVVSMVSMVGAMFMVLTTTRVVGALIAMVLSGFSFLALAHFFLGMKFFLGVKHDVVWGITYRDDVDFHRPGYCKISLDERHPKCVAESVG
jgi:hypothetical protein